MSSEEKNSTSCKEIYITTPIYYVNDEAHIGHAYTTIIADTIARYSKLMGYNTYFLTGTDEHGQKIEKSALARNKTPKEYADEISNKFRELWDSFDIQYNQFIRTTSEKHKQTVQYVFSKMHEKGDIYKGKYSGNYCISCESFFPDSQLIDDINCPDCGRETQILEESSFFFRLSKYQNQLLNHINDNPNFILPQSKKNEVIAFISNGLEDLSITRSNFEWGIKLPTEINEPDYVIYVWLDALFNYLSALGYGNDSEQLQQYWPAKVHLVGKDILRFHAIYWPIFLMSLDLPLPKHIAAHGWWTRNGEKMSKSKGNVVKPKEVVDAYGLDSFRYFLLREVPFGQDGDFSQKALIDRINGELGNDLGNLLNRIIGMSKKYSNYEIDSSNVEKYHQKELIAVANIVSKVEDLVFNMQLNRYLEELWKLLSFANKAIQEHEPWVKIKENRTEEALATVSLVTNILARVTILISPVMPETAEKIAKSLQIKVNAESYKSLIKDAEILSKFTIAPIEPLFPKIEEPRMVEATQEVTKTETAEVKTKKEKKSQEKKKDDTSSKTSQDGLITIDQFFATEIKIGTILTVEKVKKSNKLFKIKVDIGEENPRQVVAGIQQYYTEDELINTQVCLVANLKPAKLMGIESQGMLLAGKDEDGLSLIRPEKPKKIGTRIQ